MASTATSKMKYVIATDERELEALRLIAALLNTARPLSILGDGEQVPLPASLVEVLKEATSDLADGKRVMVSTAPLELSLPEAADLLNVSMPYLVRLLEEGKLPSSKVGIHCRVLFDDVIAYRSERHAKRLMLLNEMTAEAQDLGLAY